MDGETGGALISAEEIAERDCDACSWEHELWQKIVEFTAITDKEGNVIEPGDARWGEIAFEMLELDERIEVLGPPERGLSATEWEYLRAVRHERSRRNAYLQWKANQKSESGGQKSE